MSLVGYLSLFAQGLEQEDGPLLASLLSIHHSSKELLQYKTEAKVQQFLSSPWSDIVLGHIQVQSELSEQRIISATSLQNSLVQSFLTVFGQLGRWSLPVLYTVNKDLRFLAIQVGVFIVFPRG